MIFTFTPNPALDISGTIDKLVADEKSYVSEEIRSPGGNGINAARIARRLGAEVKASGLLGGMTGEELKSMLDRESLSHEFVSISGSTRFNLTVSSRKTLKQTRLSFPGPEIKGSELKKLLELIEGLSTEHVVVLGGSLPQGVKALHFAKIIRSLRKRGVLCLVDMPGPILKDVISSRPFFIKPNLTEFQQLIDRKVESLDKVLARVRELNALVPLICVSSVEGGAILVTKKGGWFGKIPKVKIQSTVGAGDSMVGGIAYYLWKHDVPAMAEERREAFIQEHGEALLRLALGAACATLAQPGMTMGQKKDILHYESAITVKALK
jgi:1-phosphofructokinase family hexose kinase